MAVQFEPPPTYAEVVLFDKEGRHPKFNPIWLKWLVDVAALLTSAGGGSGSAFSHNSTTGLQGGTTNQYFHLTSAEYTALQALEAITGLTTTIVTAKLTAGGIDGSMTFTKGLLTASTPAT